MQVFDAGGAKVARVLRCFRVTPAARVFLICQRFILDMLRGVF